MAKSKKQPVSAEVRKIWLKRVEVEGQSPPQIASQEHFDPRTVRKQLDLARQEREAREARLMVLRNAMENHYDDLRKYAEKLNASATNRSQMANSPDDDLFESALRQHLVRSPIWNIITKRNKLSLKINEEKTRLESKIKGFVNEDKRLSSLPATVMEGISIGITEALLFELNQWINGNTNHTLRDSVVMEPAERGKMNPRIGFSHLGVMDPKSADKYVKTALDVFTRIESRIKGLDEYQAVEKARTEFINLGQKLREELAVIRLRRIIPGHCRYCPL